MGLNADPHQPVVAGPGTRALPEPLPRRLNVGCGYDIRPGYLNVDSGDWHKPDFIADITDLHMLPGGHFEAIVAQDVLEHIGREKQVSALTGWGRLLAPDGVLTVRVPSLYDMAMLARHPDFQTEERQHHLVNMAYGTQAYPGDFHLCGYTTWTLAGHGREAGLIVVRASLRDEWLYDVDFRRAEAAERLDDTEWLHHTYFTDLHRCADPGGLDYWLGALKAGQSRMHVRASMRAAEGMEG